jgi:hypothetical protein
MDEPDQRKLAFLRIQCIILALFSLLRLPCIEKWFFCLSHKWVILGPEAFNIPCPIYLQVFAIMDAQMNHAAPREEHVYYEYEHV